jgi:hypothetical protein
VIGSGQTSLSRSRTWPSDSGPVNLYRSRTFGCFHYIVSNPIVLQHVYCSQNNRPHGTIKPIHSSHLSFCSRLAICDHSRKLRPQSQLCDYCDRMMQSQLATLVASRPSQINIYSRPSWSDFLIPSCIFYLHANYTTVINSISNILIP